MPTLRELLQNFSPERLDELRRTLHLKNGDAEGDVQRLLQRLDNSTRTRQLFSTLEPTEKHVLRFLLSQGGEAFEGEIIERFPDAAAAVAKLREKYVVFEDRPDAPGLLRVPQEYARFISLTPAEKSTLANLLSKQPPAYSADLAAAHGWEQDSKRSQLERLKEKWLTEPGLKSFVSALPPVEQSLWSQFLNSDGIIDTKALKRTGASADVQPGRLDPAQPLDHLYACGLVFPNRWPHPTCFLIPSDVFALAKGKSSPKVLAPALEVPSTLRTSGLRLLSDLQLLAAYQASGRLQFTQNDIPLRHQLRAFLKAIGVPEETYGLFLNMSIEVFFGAVIKKSAHTLDANPAESMSRLIAHWRDGDSWQESSHWRASRRSPDGMLDKTLSAKRLIVLKVLEELPTQQWVKYADFESQVFASGWKRVDSGVKDPHAYYHNERWPQRREFTPELRAEDTLANLAAESLVWLGIVDVGLGKIRKTGWDLTHIRLSGWGRQFLDKKSGRFEPLPPVEAESQFRVLPSLEISASPRLRPDLLAHLFKIAALKGVNSFSLTKESLREALDEGMTRDSILEFLRANSAHTLPAMVEQFVGEVAGRHGHIKLGIAGAYLQVDDPVLLLELRSHRSLKDIFQRQVGDQLALLTGRDLDRIAKTLRKMGYFPVIEKSAETERQKMKFHW